MSPLPRPRAGSLVDRGLRTVDRASERGLLWGAVTAVLLAGHGPGRRAGVRGALAALATSAVVHGVAKPLLPRVHPAAGRFPSAHAASAAAFTAGASLESRWLGGALAPVALTVVGARVALDERRAFEVGAGALLGVGVAVLTTRWWPAVDHRPARTRTARHAPALGDGAGLVLVANSSAGTPGPLEALLAGDTELSPDARPAPLPDVDAVLPRAQVLVPAPGADFVAEVEDALRRPTIDGDAARAVGVAGGDGSVAALAGVAQRHGLPLVVLPEGTLNHFARDVGIPDTPAALRAARDGDAVLVDVGLVQADTDPPAPPVAFVNTASLGGYPDMVRLREQWEDRWGKWPSAAMALARVLAAATPLVVELDGVPRTIWLLFVGNGAYRPSGMAPVFRPHLDHRVLDVRYLRADLPLSRTRFVLAVLAGTLARSRVYVAQHRDRLDVRVLGDPIGMACDGEVQPDATHFVFRIAPRPVSVYRPPDP